MVVEEERGFLKKRCTQNVSAVQCEGESGKANRLRYIRPDKPCHEIRDSLLSSSSAFTTYSGLCNLCLVLLVISIARNAIENIKMNGILIDPVNIFKVILNKPNESPSCLILLGLNVFALSSLGIEELLFKGLLSEKVALRIIITLLASEILIPAVTICLTDCKPVIAFFVLVYVGAVFLKLISYHMINFKCRETRASTQDICRHSVSSDKKSRKGIRNENIDRNLVHYPDNLNLKDLYYFMLAPTLCYELNFPRSARIRKTFLVKRVLEMLFLIQIISYVYQQRFPALHNSMKLIQEMDYLRIFENLLDLGVPCVFMIVSLHYLVVYSFFNTLAEILRFGDRDFYSDWWNTETLPHFWQKWNILVNKWCLRHLYVPLIHRGFTKSQAWTAVFFLSAIAHEYLFSIALKMFCVWSFLFMLIQVPYSMFGDKYIPNQLLNTLTWMSALIVMQLFFLLSYHDYCMINNQSL